MYGWKGEGLRLYLYVLSRARGSVHASTEIYFPKISTLKLTEVINIIDTCVTACLRKASPGGGCRAADSLPDGCPVIVCSVPMVPSPLPAPAVYAYYAPQDGRDVHALEAHAKPNNLRVVS